MHIASGNKTGAPCNRRVTGPAYRCCRCAAHSGLCATHQPPPGVPTNPGIKAAGFRARRFSYFRADPSTLSDPHVRSNTLFLADISITIEYTEAFSSDDFRL